MKAIVKNNKGITLVALTLTIIILLILAGIGIGTMSGMRENIKKSKTNLAKSDLVKIQQLVTENYIKYRQTGVERILRGKPIEYNEAATIANRDFGISLKSSQSYTLPEAAEGDDIPRKPEYYYKLENWILKEMGMDNVDSESDEYIVNYSTGEVFNITNPKSADGEALYVYAK